ncbi:MAG: flagellar filament capping protein FliD [Fimbriimonadaceae bacterium]
MSLSGINFGGLSSGIDTNSIIDRLIQLEQIPIQRMQRQQAQLTAQAGLMGGFRGRLTALSSSIGALNMAATFNPISASSSVTDTASVTASSDAAAGIYDLKVFKLAQSHKISSNASTSATAAANISGKIVINGKTIAVDPTDTLRSFATKINGASAGVTASIIDGGPGNVHLTLTSNNSGGDKAIQICDLEGSIANIMGLIGTTEGFREAIVGGATSFGMSSSTTALNTLMNMGATGNKSFTINGQAITVDSATVSLQGIADAINSSGSGAQATVRAVTVNGATVNKLDLTGVTTYADTDNMLHAIGILQNDFTNPLVAAQDAEVKIDGVTIKSATNTLTNVIPGATITLKKANATTGESTTIALTRDNTAVKDRIKDFQTKFNDMVDYIKQNSALDTETFQTGGLFGNPIVRGVEQTMSSLVFNTVTGLTSSYKNLTQIGFSFDKDGKLELNESALDTAVNTDSEAVGALFRSIGTSGSTQLGYVASTGKTKVSPPSGYAIDITQVALQHANLGEVVQTGNLAQQEVLTFNGTLFGSSAYSLVLESGLSQTQIADKINGDAKLKELVTATVDGGKLKLTSKRFGSSSNFTVTSNVAAGPNSSGWGINTVAQAGTDIAGTINGELATGNGQVLTGNKGNANTEGLQVLYSGSSTGNVGSVVFTKGIAAQVTEMVASYNDSVNGLLTANDQSLQTQIDSIAKTISEKTDGLSLKREQLMLKFARMEQAISQLQAQQSSIASFRQ